MRKVLLVLSTIFLLSSFTQVTNTTITLTDIDGTLLKSYVDINKVDGEFIATFTVDANTVVTTNTVDGVAHVYLVENGTSNTNVTYNIKFDASSIDFNHYFNGNYDLASNDAMLSSNLNYAKRPITVVID